MAASDKSAGAALVYSGGLELLGALSSIRTNSPQASAGDSQAGSSERSPRIAGKARSKAHSGAQPSLSQLSRSALRSPAGQALSGLAALQQEPTNHNGRHHNTAAVSSPAAPAAAVQPEPSSSKHVPRRQLPAPDFSSRPAPLLEDAPPSPSPSASVLAEAAMHLQNQGQTPTNAGPGSTLSRSSSIGRLSVASGSLYGGVAPSVVSSVAPGVLIGHARLLAEAIYERESQALSGFSRPVSRRSSIGNLASLLPNGVADLEQWAQQFAEAWPPGEGPLDQDGSPNHPSSPHVPRNGTSRGTTPAVRPWWELMGRMGAGRSRHGGAAGYPSHSPAIQLPAIEEAGPHNPELDSVAGEQRRSSEEQPMASSPRTAWAVHRVEKWRAVHSSIEQQQPPGSPQLQAHTAGDVWDSSSRTQASQEDNSAASSNTAGIQPATDVKQWQDISSQAAAPTGQRDLASTPSGQAAQEGTGLTHASTGVQATTATSRPAWTSRAASNATWGLSVMKGLWSEWQKQAGVTTEQHSGPLLVQASSREPGFALDGPAPGVSSEDAGMIKPAGPGSEQAQDDRGTSEVVAGQPLTQQEAPLSKAEHEGQEEQSEAAPWQAGEGQEEEEALSTSDQQLEAAGEQAAQRTGELPSSSTAEHQPQYVSADKEPLASDTSGAVASLHSDPDQSGKAAVCLEPQPIASSDNLQSEGHAGVEDSTAGPAGADSSSTVDLATELSSNASPLEPATDSESADQGAQEDVPLSSPLEQVAEPGEAPASAHEQPNQQVDDLQRPAACEQQPSQQPQEHISMEVVEGEATSSNQQQLQQQQETQEQSEAEQSLDQPGPGPAEASNHAEPSSVPDGNSSQVSLMPPTNSDTAVAEPAPDTDAIILGSAFAAHSLPHPSLDHLQPDGPSELHSSPSSSPAAAGISAPSTPSAATTPHLSSPFGRGTPDSHGPAGTHHSTDVTLGNDQLPNSPATNPSAVAEVCYGSSSAEAAGLDSTTGAEIHTEPEQGLSSEPTVCSHGTVAHASPPCASSQPQPTHSSTQCSATEGIAEEPLQITTAEDGVEEAGTATAPASEAGMQCASSEGLLEDGPMVLQENTSWDAPSAGAFDASAADTPAGAEHPGSSSDLQATGSEGGLLPTQSSGSIRGAVSAPRPVASCNVLSKPGDAPPRVTGLWRGVPTLPPPLPAPSPQLLESLKPARRESTGGGSGVDMNGPGFYKGAEDDMSKVVLLAQKSLQPVAPSEARNSSREETQQVPEWVGLPLRDGSSVVSAKDVTPQQEFVPEWVSLPLRKVEELPRSVSAGGAPGPAGTSGAAAASESAAGVPSTSALLPSGRRTTRWTSDSEGGFYPRPEGSQQVQGMSAQQQPVLMQRHAQQLGKLHASTSTSLGLPQGMETNMHWNELCRYHRVSSDLPLSSVPDGLRQQQADEQEGVQAEQQQQQSDGVAHQPPAWGAPDGWSTLVSPTAAEHLLPLPPEPFDLLLDSVTPQEGLGAWEYLAHPLLDAYYAMVGQHVNQTSNAAPTTPQDAREQLSHSMGCTATATGMEQLPASRRGKRSSRSGPLPLIAASTGTPLAAPQNQAGTHTLSVPAADASYRANRAPSQSLPGSHRSSSEEPATLPSSRLADTGRPASTTHLDSSADSVVHVPIGGPHTSHASSPGFMLPTSWEASGSPLRPGTANHPGYGYPAASLLATAKPASLARHASLPANTHSGRASAPGKVVGPGSPDKSLLDLPADEQGESVPSGYETPRALQRFSSSSGGIMEGTEQQGGVVVSQRHHNVHSTPGSCCSLPVRCPTPPPAAASQGGIGSQPRSQDELLHAGSSLALVASDGSFSHSSRSSADIVVDGTGPAAEASVTRPVTLNKPILIYLSPWSEAATSELEGVQGWPPAPQTYSTATSGAAAASVHDDKQLASVPSPLQPRHVVHPEEVIHVHLPDVMLSEGEVLVASQGQGHVADAELPSALGTFASSIGAAEPKAADGVSAAPEVVRLLVVNPGDARSAVLELPDSCTALSLMHVPSGSSAPGAPELALNNTAGDAQHSRAQSFPLPLHPASSGPGLLSSQALSADQSDGSLDAASPAVETLLLQSSSIPGACETSQPGGFASGLVSEHGMGRSAPSVAMLDSELPGVIRLRLALGACSAVLVAALRPGPAHSPVAHQHHSNVTPTSLPEAPTTTVLQASVAQPGVALSEPQPSAGSTAVLSSRVSMDGDGADAGAATARHNHRYSNAGSEAVSEAPSVSSRSSTMVPKITRSWQFSHGTLSNTGASGKQGGANASHKGPVGKSPGAATSNPRRTPPAHNGVAGQAPVTTSKRLTSAPSPQHSPTIAQTKAVGNSRAAVAFGSSISRMPPSGSRPASTAIKELVSRFESLVGTSEAGTAAVTANSKAEAAMTLVARSSSVTSSTSVSTTAEAAKQRHPAYLSVTCLNGLRVKTGTPGSNVRASIDSSAVPGSPSSVSLSEQQQQGSHKKGPGTPGSASKRSPALVPRWR